MTISSHNYGPNPVLGIRFRPTDEELTLFLLKFVSCKNFSCDHIRVENLYGNKKPWDIFENNFLGEDTKVNYFFTKLKRTKAGGSRFSRRLIGGGCWKGLDKHKSVFKGSKLIGFKKSFRYLEKEKSVDQGIKNIVWNMKEYSLNDNILKVLRQRNIIQHEDYVLCCIKRKSVYANDHKELGDHMEIAASGNNVVAVMNSTTQEHELDYITSSSEDQGTGFHDLCPSNQFASSEHNNAFDQLQLVDVQAQNIEEMAPYSVQSHVEYVGSSWTTSNQFTYYSPDNNGFQLQQDHSNVPSTLADINIDHVDMKVYEYMGSLLAEKSNTAEPHLPICNIDEQNIMCPMAQGSSSAMVNEENINAGFVSDQWSKEQVHNIEERAPITFTGMLTSSDYKAEPSLVISSDECFTMEELLGSDDDDVIAADLDWMPTQ
ncbi:PREDICTED: NAC domain-containing protein 68-like [Nicotiana attenuata]|uniref:Nac domain-containing protein 78 n=1 Tax=Nicotiana attenuata TaxID=49451 RepID=A0A314L450_NICAT|nr:PREDICTED: NAC domain-containing protein 68-like [Nicotiana attenuata]OIT35734.1 nac domain-containing protein 78 [Nicotiana attenuata]